MKYIFEIKIKPGHSVSEYVSAWERASEIIQQSDGARGTKLFKKVGEQDKLLAIATWESKTARDTAMKRLGHSDRDIQGVLHKHEEYADLRTIGEFDDTEWSVVPDKQ